MSTPTPTPEQIDEDFESLGNTFTYCKDCMTEAKESANRTSKGVDNLRSDFKELVHIIRIYRASLPDLTER